MSVTVIKDLAKAVFEQEQQDAARRNDQSTKSDGENQPATPEAGSTQGASTQDPSKSEK